MELHNRMKEIGAVSLEVDGKSRNGCIECDGNNLYFHYVADTDYWIPLTPRKEYASSGVKETSIEEYDDMRLAERIIKIMKRLEGR